MDLKKVRIGIGVALLVAGLFVVLHYLGSQNNDAGSTLKVFAYSTFVNDWGPGPELKKMFEAECSCQVEFIEAADSGILLQRMKLEGEKLKVDVVLGFDQLDLKTAQDVVSWRALETGIEDLAPEVGSIEHLKPFLPFDWGVLAFVVRKNEVPNAEMSLDDLLKPEWKGQIAIEDPRTSSPGLQFLYWIRKVKGPEGMNAYLQALLPQTHSVSSSWSLAYGLFQQKQVRTVLSYLTSPIYHLVEEKNANYQALRFKEGHPVQFELVGVPQTCRNCELAEKFVQFLVSAPAQKKIMEKNYMFPVRAGVAEGPFAEALKPGVLPPLLPPTSLEDIALKESLLDQFSKLRESL
jgi:thiamine transport system substrate-binding protein